jgi:hypothetical protein
MQKHADHNMYITEMYMNTRTTKRKRSKSNKTRTRSYRNTYRSKSLTKPSIDLQNIPPLPPAENITYL